MTREEFFAQKANGALWDVAVSIKRGNPLPLDSNSVFDSYAALETYAAGVLAYPGQIVAVVNEDSTGIYYLDQNLAIQEVGKIPTGDEKSISITDGKVQIKNFGDHYFKYVAADPVLSDIYATSTTLPADAADGTFAKVGTAETFVYYKKVGGVWGTTEETPKASSYVKTAGFVDGLQPKVVLKEGSANEYELAWYEPSTETIEGVSSKVAAVDSKVNTVADVAASNKEQIDGVKTDLYGEGGTKADPKEGSLGKDLADVIAAVGNADSGLTKSLADLTTEVGKKANAADVYTKTEADTKIGEAVAAQGHMKAQVVEGTAQMTENNVLYLVKDDTVTGVDQYNEYILIDGTPMLIGSTSTDLSGYAKTADQKVITDALSGRIDTLEAIDHDAYALKADTVAKTDYNTKISEIETALGEKLVAADLADYAKTTDVNSTIDTKISIAIGTKPTKGEDGNYSGATGIYTDIYIKDEVTKLIADITGGESAADVLTSLNAYKTTNDARVKAVEDQLPTFAKADEVYTKEQIDGKITTINDTVGGINTRLETAETKLGNIEDNAQENVIEKIVYGTQELTPVGKTVTITPKELAVATAEVLGGVKSVVRTNDEGAVVAAQNTIEVAATGIMTVNSLNVNRLVQDDGDVLILNGGNA